MANAHQEPGQDAQNLELSRDMSLFHAVMIGVGAMIGAGIFVLTGSAAGQAGPALVVAFALNGLVALMTAMSYAELGSCFPEAGGGYLWVKEALPQPFGFLSGWISWFAHAVACSLYALAFGAFTQELLAHAGLDLVRQEPFNTLFKPGMAAVVCLGFSYINFRGAGETGKAEAFVTVAKIIVIGVFLATGAAALFRESPQSFQRFSDFMPKGITGIVIAMGLTFIAFEGYEIIAQCGEELKDPKRNIPRSIFISLAVVVPIYILVAVVAIGAVDSHGTPAWEYLGQRKELGMMEAADDFFHGMFAVHKVGAIIFLIGGVFSTMSALNATIYSSSRVAFAMGRDRNLPAVMGRIHPKRRTPSWAIWISAVFIIVMAVTLPIEQVASATDAMFLFLFILVNVAVVNLRRHRPDLDRGFRVPLVPLIPLLAALINAGIAVFLFYEYMTGLLVAGGYIAAGVVLFLVYARRQEIKGYAQRTIFERAPQDQQRRKRVLVPIANPRSTPGLIRLARILAADADQDLVVLNAVHLPHTTPLSQGTQVMDDARGILSEAAALQLPEDVSKRLEESGARPPQLHEVAKMTHFVPEAIIQTVRERNASTVVLGWRGKRRRRDFFFGNVLDETVDNVPCNVVMLAHPHANLLSTTKRVLVPFITPRHSRLAFRMALAVERATGAKAVFMHVFPPERIETEEETAKAMTKAVEDAVPDAKGRFTVLAVKGRNPEGAIMLERKEGDLLVLGASEEGLLRRALFGDLAESIAGQVDGPVILVKPYVGHIKSWFQQLFGSRRPQISATGE